MAGVDGEVVFGWDWTTVNSGDALADSALPEVPWFCYTTARKEMSR